MVEPGAPTATPSVSANEAVPLQALKTKINDPSVPTLDLARALQAHLETYPQSQRTLAEKLGMPEKRSFLVQVLGLLKLDPEVQKSLEGKVLTTRAVRSYHQEDDDNQKINPVDRINQSDNQPDNHDNQADNHGNHPDNHDNQSDNHPVEEQINRVDHVYLPENGKRTTFPLIRDSVNMFSRILFFWAKDAEPGAVVERWLVHFQSIGWLKAFAGAVAIALAAYGGWQATVHARRWILERRAANPSLSVIPGLASATPKITSSRWISGHRLELRWEPQAQGTRYRVYLNSADGRSVDPLGEDVLTPGAIVNVTYYTFRRNSSVSVTAINSRQQESPASELIAFEPTAVNDRDSVEPLPLQGRETAIQNGGVPEQRPARAAASGSSKKENLPPPLPLTPPTELHADVKTPDLIFISWRPVSKDARYNVYSSASRSLANLRKENPEPITTRRVEWIPETGLDRYWIVVTTLDAQGRESAYSEAIEVIRYPERNSRAADEAAGALRKVLPW